MNALFQRVVLDNKYLGRVRLLVIEDELRMLQSEQGERYAEYIGAGRQATITKLEAEKAALGGLL